MFAPLSSTSTLETPGVGPLEAGGHDVTNVREVEQKERHANDGVEHGEDLSRNCRRGYVPVP